MDPNTHLIELALPYTHTHAFLTRAVPAIPSIPKVARLTDCTVLPSSVVETLLTDATAVHTRTVSITLAS